MDEERKIREKMVYENLSGRGKCDYYLWDLDTMKDLLGNYGSWSKTMLHRYTSGKKVLILGCGRGSEIEALKSYASSIVAIDIAERVLKIARERFSDSHIIFKKADAEALPFQGHSFDVVFCKAILHHLNLKTCLNEVRRVLASNGYLYVAAEPGLLNPIAFLRRSLFPSVIHTMDERPFIPFQFRKILNRQGFEEIEYLPNFVFSPIVPVLAKVLPGLNWKMLLHQLLSLDKFLTRTPLREFCWWISGIYRATPSRNAA